MDIKKISLDPSAITWRLSLVAALLVATNIAMQAYRLFAHVEHVRFMPLISLDAEHNLILGIGQAAVLPEIDLELVIGAAQGLQQGHRRPRGRNARGAPQEAAHRQPGDNKVNDAGKAGGGEQAGGECDGRHGQVFPRGAKMQPAPARPNRSRTC